MQYMLTFLLQRDEVFLNLVLEYIPETVYKVARQYAKTKQTIPINFIRVSIVELWVYGLYNQTGLICLFHVNSSICINCSEVWHTSIR